MEMEDHGINGDWYHFFYHPEYLEKNIKAMMGLNLKPE